MKSTELNLIPIFVAIYEEKNLSKAASRMNVSQPAVSKALKRLREIYNDPLFHRNTTGVEPTVFATDIYPAMSTALKNFTSTLSASREFDPKISNRIFSIAVVSTVSYSLIPKLMQQIRLCAPNIALEVHPQFTEDLESDLRLQRYDLVIDLALRGRTVLKSEVIYTERLRVVCRENHPRIGDSISLAEFLSEEHVAASRWHSRSSLLNADDIGELEARNIVIRAAGAFEMMPIIGSTDMIGMLPQSAIDDLGAYYKLKALDLPFDGQQHDLCTIWHPSRTADSGHRWLRQQIKKAALTE
ncbi:MULTISPECIES: LysR family transcriptional regulator [Photobacterium]|uniref:HTH-type transcriptional regulator LeuO n=1 Tax=Photobacterium piscicola TaxID=1378299 RepID=A0A1T5HY65_9GAMM|nr:MULTISPECIES: LysR family transcriptional regulator [Photobacterium]SKC31656.1 HTH-type transcriptional regulator LeuO [Photobacterium piscicola]